MTTKPNNAVNHLDNLSHGPDPQLDDPTIGVVVESNLQTSIWKLMARYEARKLPVEMSPLLVMAYCSLTRGDNLNYESYESYQASFGAVIREEKTWEEKRQRQLGLSERELEPHLARNIFRLLMQRPRLAVWEANRIYLDTINRDKLDLATEEELNESEKALTEKIYVWLRSERIPFTTKPSISIPSTVVDKALQR